MRWGDSDDWKRDYMNAERLTPGQIAALRAESDRAKAVAKAIRRGG